jgi:transposase
MTKVTTFAGFDVSKSTFDVCVLDDNKECSRQFANNKQGFTDLGNWLAKNAHCVMEATGPYYVKLACYLHQHGFAVSVVNPLVIKRFSQMRLLRAKTDRADAKMIATYGLKEQPDLWQPPAAYVLKLQQMDSFVQQLQKQRTALLCQSEAFTIAGMDKEMKMFLSKALAHLDRQIDKITARMETIIEQYHQQMVNNIVSIPGLGKKTAIMLIVISDGFKKFNNYKQLSAYVGLSPRIYESGSSIRAKARICKMGMSRVRSLLYLCSWSAKSCNKACKELYDRLLAKGKSKRLALIAVANKLIKQAFAIAANNRTYQPNYSKNICL